jgi:hypothetical protein
MDYRVVRMLRIFAPLFESSLLVLDKSNGAMWFLMLDTSDHSKQLVDQIYG